MRQDRFYWKHPNNTGRGIHLAMWCEICRPIIEGRLGIFVLQTMNDALLAQWSIRLMGHSDDFWLLAMNA